MSCYPTQTTLQSAAAGTGDGSVANLSGAKKVTVEVTGTFVGTLTFEGSMDGTNYTAVGLVKASDGTVASTATAAGIVYLPDELDLRYFRARVSAFTSGTITAIAYALTAY